MLIEGKQTCEHCGKSFDWFHQVAEPNNSIGLFHVHAAPKGKQPIRHVIEFDEKRIPKKATAYCPKCDILNTIII